MLLVLQNDTETLSTRALRMVLAFSLLLASLEIIWMVVPSDNWRGTFLLTQFCHKLDLGIIDKNLSGMLLEGFSFRLQDSG
jgi:hypothetical protein